MTMPNQIDDPSGTGMPPLAYLGKVLTEYVSQEGIRRFRAQFTTMTLADAAPRCTPSVTAVTDEREPRLAIVDLRVELLDGAATVVGKTVLEL